MKNVMIVMSLLALVGCGKQDSVTNNVLPTQTLHDVATGFQGYYLLPDGGYAEVVNDTGNLSDFTQLRIVVRNADGSTGLIPLASISNLPKTGEVLYYSISSTYAAPGNVKMDVGNTVLVGSFLTFLTVSQSGGKLVIKVQISNGVGLVFDHTITSL